MGHDGHFLQQVGTEGLATKGLLGKVSRLWVVGRPSRSLTEPHKASLPVLHTCALTEAREAGAPLPGGGGGREGLPLQAGLCCGPVRSQLAAWGGWEFEKRKDGCIL